jgi:hypothetical protein
MAVSAHFQDEINEVDATKTLVFVVNTTTHDLFEFSYSGLTITGGSDLACEYGASELMEAMGFRWYAPNTGSSGNQGRFTKRPQVIPTTLSAAKTSFWMRTNNIFLVYGHSWDNVHAADRTTLNNAYSKWATLNSMATQPFPAGHRWPGIINANQDYFSSRQHLLDTPATWPLGTSGVRLNISAASAAEYDELVELFAAQVLEDGLNIWNRTNFDPSDGDPNTSDEVFPFAKAVAAKVRSGTNPIASHPARNGVAGAELGIYAYAGHRLPPTASASPGVFTQVALAFNSTTLTYQQLVEGHGAKADHIMIREYTETQVWSKSQPLTATRPIGNYMSRYDAFVSSGAIGSTAEHGANWLINMIAMRYYIRYLKTGNYTYAAALTDCVGKIFNNDPAVRSLYELWGNQTESWHKWNLRKSMDYINAMQTSWYKTYFQQYIVCIKEYMYMPDQTVLAAQTPDDPYPAAFASMMSKVTALRLSDIIHSYAFMRQEANGRVATDYPQLRFIASPRPEWFLNPVAPTDADFAAALAAVQADTVRDADLDSNDLVLMQQITPDLSGSDATQTRHQGKSTYAFVGPGDVTISGVGTDTSVVTTSYPGGVNTVAVTTDARVSHSGGYLFAKTFPSFYKDADGTGLNHWLYAPTRVGGEINLETDVRWRFQTAGIATFDLLPPTNVSYISPNNLATGHLKINNSNTRGRLFNYNCNQYLSELQDVALMPRTIAHEDFPVHARVMITETVVVPPDGSTPDPDPPGSDDTDPPAEDDTTTPDPSGSGALTSLTLPSISPTTAKLGYTLTGDVGTWSGTGTISYVYQWYIDGVAFTGETDLTCRAKYGGSYTFAVTASDDEHFLTIHSLPVRVRPKSRGGSVGPPNATTEHLIERARQEKLNNERDLRQSIEDLIEGRPPAPAPLIVVPQAPSSPPPPQEQVRISRLAQVLSSPSPPAPTPVPPPSPQAQAPQPQTVDARLAPLLGQLNVSVPNFDVPSIDDITLMINRSLNGA